MTGRSSSTFSGTSGPTSSPDNNQPMDLAQKSQSSRITDGVTSAVKGGTTFVQCFPQLIASNAPPHVTNKSGMRTEGNMSGGGGVTLFSRQSSHGALNLVSPNSGSSLNATVGSRSANLQNPASVTISTSPSMPASAYHIPRGAAAVANMTASRSPNLASIVKTTSQIIGSSNSSALNSPRASIISQRMVPISNNSWISRNTSSAAVLTSKASSSQVIGRTQVSSGRSTQSSTIPVTTYHSGQVKSGTVVANTIRSQLPSTVRVGAANEGPKSSKGAHSGISHPASHAQKYIGMSGTTTVRGVGASTFITPANVVGTSIGSNTVYTPTSTLVTSLASSGTTITPHPGNRNPPNTVRLTSGVTTVFTQASSQASATSLSGICLTAASTGTILTHHPTALTRAQSVDQISVKTPIVRASHPPSSQPHVIKGTTPGLPAGTHISFSGPKVIAQPTQGPALAIAQLSNVPGHKTPGSVLTSQASVPFQSRTGAIVAPSVGRGGPTISMTKVIPQVKGVVNQGLPTSMSTVSGSPAHLTTSIVSGSNTDQQPSHTNVFVHRTHSVTMSTGVIPVSQPERSVPGVTQYSITTPYYIDSNQTSFPVNASLVPTNHYIPSSVNASTLRVGGNGAISTIVTTSSDVSNIQNMGMPIIKPNSSPRPSILRKRPDMESSAPLKAAKNLSAALNISMTSPPSPIRPDSRGNGNASSGSTTASANSSPGMQLNEEDSNVHNVKLPCSMKSESLANDGCGSSPCMISIPVSSRPQGGKSGNENPISTNLMETGALCYQNSSHPYPVSLPQTSDGVSPRKKPRKQQLMGNELHEARSSEDDFEQNLMKKIKKEPQTVKQNLPPVESSEDDDSEKQETKAAPKAENWQESTPSPEPVLKRPHMSLMNSYRQNWKARHNHFHRHSDVRPKEEKKRTVNEIANQKLAMQRVNGWKVMHLSGQVEDLAEMESDVISRLQVVLNAIEKRQHHKKLYKEFDKDVNRLSELVKANIQRSIIIKDQMVDAKVQMSKIFNHKDNIVNILTKYGNTKRTLRKKDRP